MRPKIKIKPMPWNEDRVDMLKALWADGLSCSQIARAIGGVSRCAVIGKVHRLGLDGRRVESRKEETRQRHNGRVRVKRRSSVRDRLVVLNAETGELTDIRDLENEPAALTMPDGKHFGTLEIGKGQCRWPHGNPKDLSTFHFCAHPVRKDSSFCPHHHSRAWDHKATARSAQKAKDASYENEHRRAA